MIGRMRNSVSCACRCPMAPSRKRRTRAVRHRRCAPIPPATAVSLIPAPHHTTPGPPANGRERARRGSRRDIAAAPACPEPFVHRQQRCACAPGPSRSSRASVIASSFAIDRSPQTERIIAAARCTAATRRNADRRAAQRLLQLPSDSKRLQNCRVCSDASRTAVSAIEPVLSRCPRKTQPPPRLGKKLSGVPAALPADRAIRTVRAPSRDHAL